MVEDIAQDRFVLNVDGQRIIVDVSAPGGVTAAIARGQRIAVVGTMEGDHFRAAHLEAPDSSPAPQAPR